MRKTMSVLLALTLLLSAYVGALPVSAETPDYIVCGDYAYIVKNGGAEILGYANTESVVTVPATLDGHTVTALGTYAFAYTDVTDVRMPNTVTTIGEKAFYGCKSLTAVTLSTGLTSIADAAFSRCSSLQRITIPESVSALGASAFSYCNNLTDIRLPGKLSATSYTYNGKAKKPSVIVKDSAGKTISSKYYSVSYPSGCKNVGSYKVKVTFKTRYSGTKYLTFKVNPPKTTVKGLTAGKKSLKVSITKKSSQVTGYQVQYSTSKKFTKATTKTVKSYKTTSYTIKSLKAKKTYYVRVRTFKTVGGVKYYSGWSTAKYKKTK